MDRHIFTSRSLSLFIRIVFLKRETMIIVEKTILNNLISSKDVTTCNRDGVQRLFQEMLGELFTPVETPEAPNRGFFKGLFGGGAQSLDREELCMPALNMHSASPGVDNGPLTRPLLFFLPDNNSVGEVAAGKASRSLAQHIPGPGGIEGMKGAASGVVGELARARIALDERGQKLGELEERTAAMMASADSFSKHAHEVGKK